MLKEVRGGRNTYGEVIGIIMNKRIFPRIPGDVGNATTFNFPVRFHIVKGFEYSSRLKLFDGDKKFIKPFVRAVKELEQIGVKAITSNCGFIILYQDILANAVNIPVFTSSLLQIPLVYKMLKRDQKVGVITADASSRGLGKKHIKAAGAIDVPLVIMGMEESEGFKAISQEKEILCSEILRDDLVGTVKEMINNNPDVGALVLECTNLVPYGKFVQEAVNLPVFDFVTLTNWVYSAIVKREFNGFM